MKLIVIDPHVTYKSPSMRAWVGAFPAIRDLFNDVEIWASACDIPEGDGVVWKRVPQRFPTWLLHSLDYQFRVTRMLSSLAPAGERLVQATACTVPKVDIRYIHYWNRAMLQECAARPKTFRLSALGRLGSMIAAHYEKRASETPGATSDWWVVSRSLAAKIQESGSAGDFRILPNQYDQARFHPGVRDEWRERMRTAYGFGPDEFILVFSAFGHFERKGLRQGVEAVEKLRAMGYEVRYLILGGKPRAVRQFQNSLTPDQRAGCVFAGLVDSIERHLVAADGLLFPSHFEAFSLAEIEAAALGLRLYLTPHYGSEMILREPENGRLLPWDPAGMAEAISWDIADGTLGKTHRQTGEAVTSDMYRRSLREFYIDAIEHRRSLSQGPG